MMPVNQVAPVQTDLKAGAAQSSQPVETGTDRVHLLSWGVLVWNHMKLRTEQRAFLRTEQGCYEPSSWPY